MTTDTKELFDSKEDQNTKDKDENYSYAEDLVGEGKRYRDNEALAKSRVDADDHIKRLEQELENARQEIQNRLNLKDYLDKVSLAQQSATNRGDDDDEVPQERSNNDYDKLKTSVLSDVEKLLEQQNKRSQAVQNVDRIKRELTSAWGSNFSSKLKARTTELGLDEAFLGTLAETKPDAFLRIVLPSNGNRSIDNVLPTASNVRSTPGSNSSVRNQAYYQKMRKENPKQYWTRQVQAQEHRDAISLGQDFFTNTK